MLRLRTGLIAALAGASAVAGVVPSLPAVAAAEPVTIYGLTTDDRIVTIDTGADDVVVASRPVTGLVAPGETLIGIDRRPNGGAVHAVGQAGTTGRLYTVDPSTGQATLVAKLTVGPAPSGASSCAGQAVGDDIVLDGTNFGFDFNPAADALRIISDRGQNLRAFPSARSIPMTGGGTQPVVVGATICDGPLNYAGTRALDVTGAAYTNSDTDPATGTTLYDLDTRLDDVVVQNPPNSGTLTKRAELEPATGALAGFDIRTVGGVNTGYVALTKANGGTKLYSIDVAGDAPTFDTTAIASVGSKNTLKGIAI